MPEQTASPDSGTRAIPFKQAFLFWLKLGFISFGGPAGQISIMHQELVEKQRWISEKRFLHALNYTMMLPGPEAQQLATYTGWLMHGVWGGIIAGVLFVLPSLFLLIALTWGYLVYGDVTLVSGILYGIKPAVTAIIVFAAVRIGTRALRNPVLQAIAVLSFLGMFAFKLPFPFIILTAGLLGLIGSRYLPGYFQTGGALREGAHSYGPAIIDDHSPTPAHARFSKRRLITWLALGVTIWLAAMAVLVDSYGWQGTYSQMGWFFTKAALLTFGGAYAVLPYVYQGGVEYYGWLSGAQMIDGLALGETTPGPLIMIVTFVGFVGGWTQNVFGGDMQILSGIAGAVIATIFTFLPSFLFILVGGPAVEATRHEIRFTAPLTGITAAVVGVIINLAVFFAWHVLWPDGFDGPFDWHSALLGVAAFILLFRFKTGIVPTIGIFAVAGMIHSLFWV